MNLLFLILPFNLAWAAAVVLPLLLTGLLMYLFLKEINLTKTAASFGAVVLPFTGFFVAWMTWGNVTSTAMWLPLVLLSIEKLAKKISPVWFLILTLAVSQVVFGGHLQTALYILLTSVLYLVVKTIKSQNRSFTKIATAAIILGLLISSVQLFPTLEFINHSARSLDQGYSSGRADWFIPNQHLIQLIAPDFFGNPTTYNYWGVWNYAEFISFIGIIPLGLALFAAKIVNPYRNFFVLLFLISLVLATANPIAKIPYTFNFPLISSLQPSRIMFLIVFSLVVLSSFGLDYFLRLLPKAKIVFLPTVIFLVLISLLVITIVRPDLFPQITGLDPGYIAARNLAVPILSASALVVIMFLKFSKIPNLFLILAIFLLTLVELFRFAYKFTPFAKLSWIFPQTQTTDFLASQEKPFRIMTTDRRIMHPNISSVYGIESADGYDPLYLANYAQYISVLQSQNPNAGVSPFNRIVTPQNFSSKLTSLANIEYILSFDTLTLKELELVMTEGQTKVYRNKKSLKRAFFVDEVVKISTPQQEFNSLLDPNFDLTKKATSQEFSTRVEPKNSNLAITNYRDQGLSLVTDSDTARPLVVTNIYYPGWQATIDGQKTKIYKANGIFQLIVVPEGSHRIEFNFRPRSFYNGAILSALALLTTSASAYLIWRKRYQ